MDRLTIKPGICANASTDYCESQEDCYLCPHGKEIRFRLSSYEDTGRLPEEIKKDLGILDMGRRMFPDLTLDNLREFMRFSPGEHVHIVERDEAGNAVEVSGYILLAVSGNAVIVSSFVNDLEGLDEHLEYHIEETAENYDTHLSVFPVSDCYPTQADAVAELEKENG